ncbi:MAG TPA: collagen-like protein [Candidatus Limosilactobacillus intestinipullorum]|nr:collagen-like protein [Candidatus Limosilactobacillus intestinipullorum]
MANAMRSLDNIETNDMNFKHLETTKDIVISPKNEYGDPQRPDPSHRWTAKVSDGSNYIGDYAVKITGTSMVVDSEDFTQLPVGKYYLEVWEEWNDSDGTSERSIYPSPQQTIPFTIYQNITDLAQKEIKEITFQDVVDQAVMNIGMNYVFKVNTIDADQNATVVQTASDGKNFVTFNIPRGAKGDTGSQGIPGIQGVPGDPGGRGPEGKQGPKGDPGKPFSISKVFKSKAEMKGDGLSEGDFVIIASTVDDPDNADLFVWDGKEFNFIVDLSGATGIQGPRGLQGIQGIPGDPGVRGPEGKQGVPGKDGKDADNNAIENALKSYVDTKMSDSFDKAKAAIEDEIANGKW